jgi:hypothetical protein
MHQTIPSAIALGVARERRRTGRRGRDENNTANITAHNKIISIIEL